MKDYQKEYAVYTAGEKKMNELYHQIAIKSGISDTALWVLYCLTEQDTTHTQNDIAQKIAVPKQTVNSSVSRLMKEGYIYLEKMAVARNNKQLF